MRVKIIAITLALILPLVAGAQQVRHYRWVDKDGVVHYGDSIPTEYAELPKDMVNDRGIKVGEIEGKKSPEQLAAEQEARELKQQQELQLRADRALLATYLSVDEIQLHRDRRVELFQAQSRVTELYLRNLRRALDQMQDRAKRFKPYSSDPSAPQVDPGLVNDIDTTKSTIARHEGNLLKYQSEEQQIIARFEGDIDRFKILKGID